MGILFVQSDCAFSLLDKKISFDALAWQVVFALDMVPGFMVYLLLLEAS